MAETDSSVAVTQKIVDILDGQKVALGIAAVYFGDRTLIPEFPSVVCESGVKERDLVATKQYGLILRTDVYIYHGKIQSDEANRKETEQFAEAVEAVLLQNATLDGLVIYGFVESMATGRIVKASAMIRATRLVFRAVSRKLKP